MCAESAAMSVCCVRKRLRDLGRLSILPLEHSPCTCTVWCLRKIMSRECPLAPFAVPCTARRRPWPQGLKQFLEVRTPAVSGEKTFSDLLEGGRRRELSNYLGGLCLTNEKVLSDRAAPLANVVPYGCDACKTLT